MGAAMRGPSFPAGPMENGIIIADLSEVGIDESDVSPLAAWRSHSRKERQGFADRGRVIPLDYCLFPPPTSDATIAGSARLIPELSCAPPGRSTRPSRS